MRCPLAIAAALVVTLGCSGPQADETAFVLEPTMTGSENAGDWVPRAASSEVSGGNSAAGGSDEEYRASLLRRRTELRGELEALPIDRAPLVRKRKERELEMIQERLDDVARAFVEQERRTKLAKASLQLFLERAESESWWEIDYAIKSGELSLVRSIVQDNLLRVERDAAAQGLNVGEVRRLAAQAFLKLSDVAESGADFEEAERALRLAAKYSSDLAVSMDALAKRAELLESLGEKEEAMELARQQHDLLRAAGPR